MIFLSAHVYVLVILHTCSCATFTYAHSTRVSIIYAPVGKCRKSVHLWISLAISVASALVSSRLDYANSVLFGCHNHRCMQFVFNEYNRQLTESVCFIFFEILPIHRTTRDFFLWSFTGVYGPKFTNFSTLVKLHSLLFTVEVWRGLPGYSRKCCETRGETSRSNVRLVM